MPPHAHEQRWKWFSGAVFFTSLILTVLLWSYSSVGRVQAGIFATLPPIWTTVPSLTPSQTLTPTMTPSPTLSPTPTSTLSPEQICERFELTVSPIEGVHVGYQDRIGFSWTYAPEDSIVVLSLIPVEGGEETLTGFLPFEGFNALFPVRELPGWGTYRWTITVYRESDGEMCLASGTFTHDPWWIEPLENPLAPPFAY